MTMDVAAELLGCSRPQVYRLAAQESHIRLVRLSGRTLVETGSLLEHMSVAERYVPSGKDHRGAALGRKRGKAPGPA